VKVNRLLLNNIDVVGVGWGAWAGTHPGALTEQWTALERLLSSDAAQRLDPETWAGVEAQLADAARQYRPNELAHHGATLIELLDQDGPPPDDADQLVNELHLAKSRTGGGGRIKGRLDAATFDAVKRAIRASLPPVEPDPLGRDKSLGERQAEALGAICEHALDDGYLPTEGGERPHISAIIDFETQRHQARGARLEFGGTTPPPPISAG